MSLALMIGQFIHVLALDHVYHFSLMPQGYKEHE